FTVTLASTMTFAKTTTPSVIEVFSASYNVTEALSLVASEGWVYHFHDDVAAGWGFSNPLLGGALNFPLGTHFAFGLNAGVTIPVGSGGGNDADDATVTAMLSGLVWAGPMFAANYLTPYGGATLSLTAADLKVALGGTVYEAIRVRGEQVTPWSPLTLIPS